MNNVLEILRALAYVASIIRSALGIYGWWKEHKQPDSEGR